VKHLIIIVAVFFISLATNAQTGILTGKVISNVNNQPLTGVTIYSQAKKISTTSDVEGNFILKLPAGSHELNFSFTGYQTKKINDIVIQANKTSEFTITLEEQKKDLTEVIVTSSSARKESAASLLSLQKNNLSVSDGISSEAIKRSPDRNVGEVLKRVSGTSVQDDKYVIVRGLNDRYNVATINGAVMPSTEPDRRAFSFDVVPSSMIDNVLINKTATPDMPGEFSGGIIQITTKDIPFSNSFGLSVGTSYNTISTGKNFNIGYMGAMDYLGFDDGTRRFPKGFPSTNRWRSLGLDQKIAASKKMHNTYGNRVNATALPGINAQMNFGKKISLKSGGTVGIVGAVNYRNSQTVQYTDRQQYNDATGTSNLLFDYVDSTYSFQTNLGALLNVGYKKGRNKIVLKSLFNRILENNNTVREGYNYNDLQYVEKNRIGINQIKTIATTQLEGEHAVGKSTGKLRWNLNYAFTKKDQPDYRAQPFQKSIGDATNKDVAATITLRNTYRFWSDLNENTFGGKVDYSKSLNWGNTSSNFKAGVLAQYKTRSFSARAFRYEQASGVNFNSSLLTLPAEKVFSDATMYANGFYLNEITNNTDRYDATSMLTGSYAMVDNKFNEKWRLIWGVRVETFGYDVETGNVSGTREMINRDYVDVLPSANLIYSFNQKSNLRFSASKTVSRPDFREVANFSFFDLVRGAIVRGNANLERSQNTNLDLRFETYPQSGEVISATVFFKHFKNPIEQRMSGESTFEYQVLTFFNPASAVSYGIELDFRKKLTFLGAGKLWDNLTFSANTSLIKSSVDLAGSENNSYDENRPMQGQSPYLVNLGLAYSDSKNNWGASVLFNRIGHRIETVGAVGLPDIYENGRSVLDFQVSKKMMNNKAEFKLNVANLLNTRQIFYNNVEGTKTQRAYKESTDRVQWGNLFGVNIGVGFAYNF
jgi:TonB-dependent receptor